MIVCFVRRFTTPPPPSFSSAFNPDLLDPIDIMSSSPDRSPSAHSPSARELEETAELDAYLERRAGSTPSPRSPHDSPGGAQGGAGEDRDSSEGTPDPKQGDDPEFSYGYPDHEEVTISPEAVAELVRSYSIPPAFESRAAGPGDRASRPPPGFVAVYRAQLIGGLRLPTPSALAETLSY